MTTKPSKPVWNDYQRLALELYAQGHYSGATSEADLEGDTLSVFVVRELQDVRSWDEVLSRLYRAAKELEELADEITMLGEGEG